MRKGKCEICGCRIELGFVERHHVIPTQVTEENGLPESQTLRLCSNCHREVHTWYSAKGSVINYDPKTKRFITKAETDIVKEYDSALNSFIKYKKKRIKQL